MAQILGHIVIHDKNVNYLQSPQKHLVVQNITHGILTAFISYVEIMTKWSLPKEYTYVISRYKNVKCYIVSYQENNASQINIKDFRSIRSIYLVILSEF